MKDLEIVDPSKPEPTPEVKPEEAKPEAKPEGEPKPEAKPEGTPAEPEMVTIKEFDDTGRLVESEYAKGSPEHLAALQKGYESYQQILPEFTKRSQELADLKTGGKPAPEDDTPAFMKPGWIPQTYEELQEAIIEAAKHGAQEALRTIDAKSQTVQNAQDQVNTWVAGVMKVNPDFNEDDFFSYVNRHKFQIRVIEDLKSAYSSYAETNKPGKPAAKPEEAKPGEEKQTLPYDPHRFRVSGLPLVEQARQAIRLFKK